MAEAPPSDLATLMRALELIEEEGDGRGIDLDEIALVEAAWELSDVVLSSNGWVLSLHGRGRVYLEYTIDNTRNGAITEEITLIKLRPDQAYPALENDTGILWYRPDELNRRLGITPQARR